MDKKGLSLSRLSLSFALPRESTVTIFFDAVEIHLFPPGTDRWDR